MDDLTDERLQSWFRFCYRLAETSPDTSTQNGAILVGEAGLPFARGTNTFTRGAIVSPERLERPAKYSFIEHAERNAIYDAARKGVSTQDLTMACVWAACADCARAIVQAGVTRLVRHAVFFDGNDRWAESIALGDAILKEGGVEIVDWRGVVLEAPPILHDGSLFYADRA